MSLASLPGLGPKKQQALAASGLTTLRDLIWYLPFRYIDRTRATPIESLRPQDDAYFIGEITGATRRATRLIIEVNDGSGTLDLVFFHGADYLAGKFREGAFLKIAGQVGEFDGLQLAHPEFELWEKGKALPLEILPRYSLTESLTGARIEHKALQRWALASLDDYSFSDPIGEDWIQQLSLMPEVELLRQLHSPPTMESIAQNMRQVKMREALPWLLEIESLRKTRLNRGRAFPSAQDLQAKLRLSLPFQLTEAQNETIAGLCIAMQSPHQMEALVQGDVGSGKTLVGLLAAIPVLKAHSQVALIAPTEILARQHFQTAEKFLQGAGFSTAFLTGEIQGEVRKSLLKNLASGEVDLLVGTHALLSEGVVFKDLGLVLIDEQHRFGVAQREAMSAKGTFPHIIHLSATPIPRSLTQALYGDLEVFNLIGKPPGRQPIKTRIVPAAKKMELMSFLKKEAGPKRQIYWVVPRIGDADGGESNSSSRQKEPALRDGSPVAAEKAALSKAREALALFLPSEQVAMVHGRMALEMRQEILDRFREGDIIALCATTVIEVGIDVATANIMVIEGADRFGMAQLHQLRGRTGRGIDEAWCFLVIPEEGWPPEVEERLRKFSQIDDGFEIAELDLSTRGAGHLVGKAQSGFGTMPHVDWLTDSELLIGLRAVIRDS